MPEFSRRKPVAAGRYKWRLPESEKSGYYVLDVEIADSKDGSGLTIYSDEGDSICTLADARGGSWLHLPA